MTEKDIAKEGRVTRIMYIIEAALEYFISLVVIDAYLAKVTGSLGISDGVTGILTAFVQLGEGFQILAVFLFRTNRYKRKVSVLHTLNQAFFAFVYLVPVTPFSGKLKAVLFIGTLLLGHIINNAVNSPKITWLMSWVENSKRGIFTARKEMVSLAGGMIFTFVVGNIMDKFEASGNLEGSFIVCGGMIFALTIAHTLTLVFSKEKPEFSDDGQNEKLDIKSVFSDKTVLKIIPIRIFFTVATSISVPFYGVYKVNDLKMSMSFIAVIAAGASILRIIVSPVMGRLADKYSFSKVMTVCYLIAFAGFAAMVFTVPSNGKVFFCIHLALYNIAMAGINSGTINLLYDYVEDKKRMPALAVQNTLGGVIGFFVTVVASKIVNGLQENGNVIFGQAVYAQQILSAVTAVAVLGVMVYMLKVVNKIEK